MSSKSASRNRTLRLDPLEQDQLCADLYIPPAGKSLCLEEICNTVVHSDLLQLLPNMPSGVADLVILDPPYNMYMDFHGFSFSKRDDESYYKYVMEWFPHILRILKPEGSLYFCGDWKNSSVLYRILQEHVRIQNRITWQREKGRGAKTNWKNSCEDIWFATKSDTYFFDIESVKVKRLVRAPYLNNGEPKDWEFETDEKYRMTCPGNLWDDISVPFWSMSENTDHPTQKPEKLIAKLVLASCPPAGLVFDPFLGSGTTAVVAKKLGRSFIGVEMNAEYCCWAKKRLQQAEGNSRIQGYEDGVFYERNTAYRSKRSR